MDGRFFTCFATLSVGKGLRSQKEMQTEDPHEVEEFASTAMTCSYFLHFLSECGSYFLGCIIPGVSEKTFVWNLETWTNAIEQLKSL